MELLERVAALEELLAWRARSELDQGHWDAAADSAGEVLHNARTLPPARIQALAVVGRTAARRGRPRRTGSR